VTRRPRRPAAAVKSSGPRTSDAVVMGIAISKPEKEMWPAAADSPAVSKLDLALYYEAVAPWILPHVAGRPCSIVRAPDGVNGAHFFQRHAMPGVLRSLQQVDIDGERKPYLQIVGADGLIELAQAATLEIHPWGCQPGEPLVPGRLVFDLDPGPGVEFAAVVAAALEVRDRLRHTGLEAFCKTTGGKGLHVVSPLARSRDAPKWPEAKAFAREVCARMAADHPDEYVVNMAKAKRRGHIYLDYLRNDKTASAVAPLSPRAREGAPVGMPLAWTQVRATLDPRRYTIHSVVRQLARAHPWEDYRDAERPLGPAIRQLSARGG
jgi:bifunctional non-homologous end joining protein LigD